MQIIYTRKFNSTHWSMHMQYAYARWFLAFAIPFKMQFSVICFVSLFASYVTLTNANHFVAFHFDRHKLVEDRKQCKEFSFFGSYKPRGSASNSTGAHRYGLLNGCTLCARCAHEWSGPRAMWQMENLRHDINASSHIIRAVRLWESMQKPFIFHHLLRSNRDKERNAKLRHFSKDCTQHKMSHITIFALHTDTLKRTSFAIIQSITSFGAVRQFV